MKRVIFILAVALSALLCVPAFAAGWLLSNVKVIDLESGEVSADQDLLIVEGKIHAQGPTGSITGAEQVIDGQGGYVIPGLAEMHAHVPSSSQGAAQTDKVLKLFLANGITTIRGMLGQPAHLDLRDRLRSGEQTGPRLFTSGPSFNGNSVSSPQQAAKRVREQAEAGYDFLKIHPGLSREEFIALAEAARSSEIPIAGHVSPETGLETALAQGQATIDHLDAYAQEMVPRGHELHGVAPQFFGINLAAGMDPSRATTLARKTAAANVWQVPTQSLMETTVGTLSVDELLARPGMDMLSEGLKDNWVGAVRNIRSEMSGEGRVRYLAARRALLKAMSDEGAGLLLGSDAPQIMNVPGYSTHQELAYLVGAGLTPLEALRTGTVNVAAFFGDDDHGQVASGMVADLILLGSNPVEDISNTTDILGVARAGVWFDRKTLDAMLDEVRADPL